MGSTQVALSIGGRHYAQILVICRSAQATGETLPATHSASSRIAFGTLHNRQRVDTGFYLRMGGIISLSLRQAR
jgi:hypothetical protein